MFQIIEETNREFLKKINDNFMLMVPSEDRLRAQLFDI
ncbi:hypothetical protein PRO82_000460 [Candidatus Protochlamydia amoebophila]|nr:hypothetical protein [Candidatus Protochlamydia amoebophila]